MVIRNNAANRKLVKKMRDVVDAETGFRAIVHNDWNVGKDIHFEISVETLRGLYDEPFAVGTDIDKDGNLDVSLTTIARDIPMDFIWLVAARYNSLMAIIKRLDELLTTAKPELSYYKTLKEA